MGVTLLPATAWDPASWRTHRFGLDAHRQTRLGAQAIWVTGAGTGFGRAVATALGLLGCRVVLTGRRLALLQDTADALARSGAAQRGELLPLDLRDPAAVARGVERLRESGVTGLVHCAAVPQPPEGPAPLAAGRSLPAVMASNVEAAWHAGQALLRAAGRDQAVRLVFYSSEAAWHFTPGYGPYNVSKAALNSLAGSLAHEAAAAAPGRDVQINVLNPGEARTEMNRGSDTSPFTAVPMTLALLAHGAGGPNGRFFHADGRHLAFGEAAPWPAPLLPAPTGIPPRLVGSEGVFNVVAFRGRFYVVPQSLGTLDLGGVDVMPPGVLEAPTLEDALAAARAATR